MGHQWSKDLSRVVVHKQLCCLLGAARVNFFYPSFPVVQYGSLEEACRGPCLSRRVKPSHALALLQKGWFSSGCIITLMREVMSSLAPLSLAVSLCEANGLCWLRKKGCLSTQGIFTHKVVLVVYLRVWNIYIFFSRVTYEREVLNYLLCLSFHVISAWLPFCSSLGYRVKAYLTDGKSVWLIFVELILCGF